MNKNEQLILIKKRANDLLDTAINTKNENEIKLYALILEILTNKNSLNNLDFETILNILTDLKFTSQEIPLILKNLVKQ